MHKYVFKIVSTALLAGFCMAAHAQDYTDAEVRKVEKENNRITLRHGEIKNLDMPAMTMVFHVNDASVLDRLKAGDKVRFKAAQEAGKFIVTDIQPAR